MAEVDDEFEQAKISEVDDEFESCGVPLALSLSAGLQTEGVLTKGQRWFELDRVISKC